MQKAPVFAADGKCLTSLLPGVRWIVLLLMMSPLNPADSGHGDAYRQPNCKVDHTQVAYRLSVNIMWGADMHRHDRVVNIVVPSGNDKLGVLCKKAVL